MANNISRIKNTDLETGMKIIIPAGTALTIDGAVYPSNISPGFTVAETNEGPIYLANDRTTELVFSDAPVEPAGVIL